MLISEILKKKRDGFELSANEIEYIVEGLKNSNVSDIQAASFLMASCINGLTIEEITTLTFAMRDSGSVFDFSSLNKPKVDKHSTGGVGDKISLLITPICMEFDIAVPMISGRGLGHTGGTVDKLESITDFKIRLNKNDYLDLLKSNNVFMACQTDDIAPADKKLYHIRDVTGTVESVGLITASILSKKLVEDLDALVIDMKFGNGAFMQTIEQAKQLADSMANVAKKAGLKMRIIFSSMEQPLGNKIGNWLEIEETISALQGNCPNDVREITEKLTSAMLLSVGVFNDENEALEKIRKVWSSGKAYKNFIRMIEAQNGNLEASAKKYSNYPTMDVLADKSGYIIQIDTLYTGLTGIMIGAGRRDINDRIDYGAGIILHKKVGDFINKGDVIATLKSKDITSMQNAVEFFKNCIIIGDSYIAPPKLIIEEWVI